MLQPVEIDNKVDAKEEKMGTIRDCIQRQEDIKQYIARVDARIQSLKETKKRLKCAYYANKSTLTTAFTSLNTKHLSIDDKVLRIMNYKRVEVLDETQIPETYLKRRVIISVDKSKIRRDLHQNPDLTISGVKIIPRKTTTIITKED